MKLEKLIGDLKHYKRYLQGEDYQPIPKLTTKHLDGILLVLEVQQVQESAQKALDRVKLLEQAREEAEELFPYPEPYEKSEWAVENLRQIKNADLNSPLRKQFMEGAQFIINKLNERKSE